MTAAPTKDYVPYDVFLIEEEASDYGGDDPIRAEPFDAIEIAPPFVWGRNKSP